MSVDAHVSSAVCYWRCTDDGDATCKFPTSDRAMPTLHRVVRYIIVNVGIRQAVDRTCRPEALHI